MAFLHALAGVFSLLIVVALGYILASRRWFSPSSVRQLPRLITNVALPPFLAHTIITSFQRDNLLHMLYGALPPFLGMGLLFLAACLIARLMRVDRRHFGLFCACVSNPNTIFIGIPVNMALFGPEALPYVLLFYFASACFFWSVGNYFIARDESDSRPGVSAGKCGIEWGKIISAPMWGFLAGLAMVCMDISPPDFILLAASIIGQLTTPLALIFIGITLQGIGFGRLRPNRDMLVALTGRMLVSPLLFWSMLPFFGLPELMFKVYVVQSGLPVLMQVAILSAYYGTDPDFGSIMVALSTIACAITIPLLMVLV